jgi:hypothetical protein
MTLFFDAYFVLPSYSRPPREIGFVWRTSFFADGLHVLQITIVLGRRLDIGFVWRLSHSDRHGCVTFVTIVPVANLKNGFDWRNEESFVRGEAHPTHE